MKLFTIFLVSPFVDVVMVTVERRLVLPAISTRPFVFAPITCACAPNRCDTLVSKLEIFIIT